MRLSIELQLDVTVCEEGRLSRGGGAGGGSENLLNDLCNFLCASLHVCPFFLSIFFSSPHNSDILRACQSPRAQGVSYLVLASHYAKHLMNPCNETGPKIEMKSAQKKKKQK